MIKILQINIFSAFVMSCIVFVSDGLSTSILMNSPAVAPITTNRSSIAYCAIEFASETNKIPIAAAAKVLTVYDKIIEAKSAEMACLYYLGYGDAIPIEQYLQKKRYIETRLSDKLQRWIKLGFTDYSYESLDVLDDMLDENIMNEQLVSRLCYNTKYENMQSRMSDKQFSAFIVIHAYYRARMNEVFIKLVNNKRFRVESSAESDTKEVEHGP